MRVVPFCLGVRLRVGIISLCNTTFLVLISWSELALETTHYKNADEILALANLACLIETQ